MNRKISSVISEIKLNRATFTNTSIENLTFINFFYGNNGVGKSTVASAISENDGVNWTGENLVCDYDILVYNQDFIDRNFSDYDNLPGVFTVHEENIKLQHEINVKKENRKQIGLNIEKSIEVLKQKRDMVDTLIKTFQEDCWSKTASIRADFELALEGKKHKKKFADAILCEENPKEYSLSDLKNFYNTAFDSLSKVYNKFLKIDKTPTYGKLSGKDLLNKMIVSRSNIPFARFINEINSSDWVRFGHTHYSNKAKGQCPYCQQELPENFEEKIAACFDAQYEKDIYDLQQFQTTYDKETKQIINCLKKNLMGSLMETIDLTQYNSKIVMLERLFEINSQRLNEKINQPAKVISLENTDSLLLEIGNLIDDINGQIDINNQIVSKKRIAKSNCKKWINEHLAFVLESDVRCYKNKMVETQKEIEDIESEINKLKKEFSEIDVEISKLSFQTVNTESTINSINKILKDSGFQGFSLKTKDELQNTYEIVRDNQTVKRLSEGEKNFIAFLYFYHVVRGSVDRGKNREKIVVIDDPVSCMDNNAVLIASSIVREMINVCKNNTEYKNSKVSGDYIKQIFIFTHNVNFYKEITYQEVKYYSLASFYLIKKNDNISTVKLCDRQITKDSKERENYSPVKNAYDSLWSELQDIKSINLAINVMSRIIQYYFLNICGYSINDLRTFVFEKVNAKDYQLASILLSRVDNPYGLSDGVNYVEEFYDIDSCNRVFKTIFDLTNHSQHYNMMTS